MSTTLECIVRQQMVTYLVSRTITGALLDTRTCMVFADRDGDPAYVVSPDGWAIVRANDELRSTLQRHGLTLPEN